MLRGRTANSDGPRTVNVLPRQSVLPMLFTISPEETRALTAQKNGADLLPTMPSTVLRAFYSPNGPQGDLHSVISKLRHTEHEASLAGSEGIEPILSSHLKGLSSHAHARVVFHGSSATGTAIPGVR